MNQKGFSHYLILVVVAVLAIVGAAGFIVYRRNSANALYISELGCNSTPTLRQGSTGNCVRALQNRINMTQCFTQMPVDGQFGPVTRARVMDYQRRARITVDGVVGMQTWGNILQGRPGVPVNCRTGK